VRDDHELKDLSMTDAYPLLGKIYNALPECMKCETRQSKLKKTMQRYFEKTYNIKSEEALKEDPMTRLGSGILLYRNLMFNTSIVFLLITLLAIPSLIIYRNGKEFEESNIYNPASQEVIVNQFSLRNLGQASVQCQQAPLKLG
jgi:hypothetical protein